MSQRMYDINGKAYPSVTTILNIINKPGLMYWYGKIGTANANKIKRESAMLGKLLHKYAEMDAVFKAAKWYEKSEDVKRLKSGHRKTLHRLINEYLRFKENRGYRPFQAEVILHNHKYKYAGTADSIGILPFKGRKTAVLVDWKTSARIYSESLLQLAAYYYAYKEMVPKNKVKGICCVAFNKEKNTYSKRIIFNKKKIKYFFRIFLKIKALYEWSQKYGG